MTMFRNLNFDPSPRPQGAGTQKNCTGACAIRVSNSHTKSGWISEKNVDPQTLQGTLKGPPLGMTQAAEWMLYIFHLWEDTHSLVIDFVIPI